MHQHFGHLAFIISLDLLFIHYDLKRQGVHFWGTSSCDLDNYQNNNKRGNSRRFLLSKLLELL